MVVVGTLLFKNTLHLYFKVLVVQALRPDRLQSAMALFACKTLGKYTFFLDLDHGPELFVFFFFN